MRMLCAGGVCTWSPWQCKQLPGRQVQGFCTSTGECRVFLHRVSVCVSASVCVCVQCRMCCVPPCSAKESIPSVLDFVGYSQRAQDTLHKVKAFMEEYIYPSEKVTNQISHMAISFTTNKST